MTSIKRKRKNSLSVETVQTVQVRRFEMGATGIHFFSFLESCGYTVHATHGGRYSIRKGKSSRFRLMTRKEILELIDKLRKNRGLEPILKGQNK